MSLEKTIKAVDKFAAVTFTGTGSGNISLSELATENQTASAVGLKCFLTDIRYKAKSDILITSNDKILWIIKKDTIDEFQEFHLGRVPQDDGRSDITVKFEGTEPSTITLAFSKEGGFVNKTN
jgi:hypothetical protein